MKNKELLIFPNGYGKMQYINQIQEILDDLSINNRTVCIDDIVEVRNDYNSKTIKKFLPQLLSNQLNKYNEKVTILAHCSSLTYFVELIETNFNKWDKINKIILYSFLADPLLHYDRFRKKAMKLGINITENRSYLEKFSNIKIYEKIPVPIEVIHSDTLMNRFRANNNDLLCLEKNKNVKQILKPKKGYEIINEDQKELITYILKEYLLENI